MINWLRSAKTSHKWWKEFQIGWNCSNGGNKDKKLSIMVKKVPIWSKLVHIGKTGSIRSTPECSEYFFLRTNPNTNIICQAYILWMKIQIKFMTPCFMNMNVNVIRKYYSQKHSNIFLKRAMQRFSWFFLAISFISAF